MNQKEVIAYDADRAVDLGIHRRTSANGDWKLQSSHLARWSDWLASDNLNRFDQLRTKQ
jgi:hypothetical protein